MVSVKYQAVVFNLLKLYLLNGGHKNILKMKCMLTEREYVEI